MTKQSVLIIGRKYHINKIMKILTKNKIEFKSDDVNQIFLQNIGLSFVIDLIHKSSKTLHNYVLILDYDKNYLSSLETEKFITKISDKLIVEYVGNFNNKITGYIYYQFDSDLNVNDIRVNLNHIRFGLSISAPHIFRKLVLKCCQIADTNFRMKLISSKNLL